jgi:hypothetical protein
MGLESGSYGDTGYVKIRTEDSGDIHLSASGRVAVPDNTKLTFGETSPSQPDGDAYIYYRETGDDYLVISGSAAGLVLSGNIVVDGNGDPTLLVRGGDTRPAG